MDIRDFNGYKENLKKNETVDYNNKDCVSCNDCCGIFTLISKEEYQELHKYLTKNKLGKIVYERAIHRVLTVSKEQDVLYLVCPLSTGTKKCELYKKRPRICRDFHCSASESKVTNENKRDYGDVPIFYLFKEDLLKDKDYKEKFMAMASGLLQEFDK